MTLVSISHSQAEPDYSQLLDQRSQDLSGPHWVELPKALERALQKAAEEGGKG